MEGRGGLWKRWGRTWRMHSPGPMKEGVFQESVGGVERDGKEKRLKRVKTEEKNDVFS